MVRRSRAVPRGLLLCVALLFVLSASRAGAAGVPPVGDPLGMEFVLIPGGEFEMGSNVSPDEKPVHRVRIAEFKMGKSEVTQAQWQAVMGNNPSKFSGCDDCPVERVSWNDVQDFITKASAQTGLSLRLPTEAEWEYAAGGGVLHQPYAGTDKDSELGEYAWYDANAAGRTHPVCQKRPNQFGLCDMSGNIWEWCSDWYGDNYYAESPIDNPTGPPSSRLGRVHRGGGWGLAARYARSADRYWYDPSDTDGYRGFRLVAR